MIHSTFSFDESSVWDPTVLREHLCIPEEQLNILSNIPGWSKVTDNANTSRIDKDTTTQNSQPSQFNISVTTQNCQKDTLILSENCQKDSPVPSQNCPKDSLVPSQNCQEDSLVPSQNCQKDSPVTAQNCQKVAPSIELFDKDLQLHVSALKTFKVYGRKFTKSTSLCELDKISEILPTNGLLKKTLSLPLLNHGFDNFPIKSLPQNSDCEIASPEKSLSRFKILATHKPVKQSLILDQKDTFVTNSTSPSKTSLKVMEVVSQLPVNISSHIEKLANESVVPVVEQLNILSVVHTTESSDNSSGQPTAIENGIVHHMDNGPFIACENEHKNKPNSESHENKLDSCITEIIPTSVGPSIDSEKDKMICNAKKSIEMNETPAVNIESLKNMELLKSLKSPKSIESSKPLANEQTSSSEKLISNQEYANLQDSKVELRIEQKVSRQEIGVEADKLATEGKCAQGKRKSEFKVKSSKKRKSNRDVKPDDGEKRPNETRSIKRASEISFIDEDTINMINILKHYYL